jgi:hypothetical protein
VSTEFGGRQDDRQCQHERRDWVGVGRDAFVSLPGNERGEYDEDDDNESTSERMVVRGGQVSPLVFDREDGGPTIQVSCSGMAAPLHPSSPNSTQSRLDRDRWDIGAQSLAPDSAK